MQLKSVIWTLREKCPNNGINAGELILLYETAQSPINPTSGPSTLFQQLKRNNVVYHIMRSVIWKSFPRTPAGRKAYCSRQNAKSAAFLPYFRDFMPARRKGMVKRGCDCNIGPACESWAAAFRLFIFQLLCNFRPPMPTGRTVFGWFQKLIWNGVLLPTPWLFLSSSAGKSSTFSNFFSPFFAFKLSNWKRPVADLKDRNLIHKLCYNHAHFPRNRSAHYLHQHTIYFT